MFRKHGRTPVRTTMVLKHKTCGRFEVHACDISASGLFVEFTNNRPQQPLRVGDRLEAQLESLDSEPERLRLKVARLTNGGLGLTFA